MNDDGKERDAVVRKRDAKFGGKRSFEETSRARREPTLMNAKNQSETSDGKTGLGASSALFLSLFVSYALTNRNLTQ